ERALGFSVRENSPQVIRELLLEKPVEKIVGGVIVSEVDPLGPAADSRLSVGNIILEANRQPINNLEDFHRAISTLKTGSVLIIPFTPLNSRSFSIAAIRLGNG